MEKNDIQSLKPCPFCNSNAVIYSGNSSSKDVLIFYVKCPNCGLQTRPYEVKKNDTNRVQTLGLALMNIITRWNCRFEEPKKKSTSSKDISVEVAAHE